MFKNEFQFQYGAILRINGWQKLGLVKDISIPVWCDFENWHTFRFKSVPIISIPVWCDFEKSKTKIKNSIFTNFNSSMVRF